MWRFLKLNPLIPVIWNSSYDELHITSLKSLSDLGEIHQENLISQAVIATLMKFARKPQWNNIRFCCAIAQTCCRYACLFQVLMRFLQKWRILIVIFRQISKYNYRSISRSMLFMSSFTSWKKLINCRETQLLLLLHHCIKYPDAIPVKYQAATVEENEIISVSGR